MARSTATATKPTITDEQYKVLLANRLAAMKAFEADPSEDNNTIRLVTRAAVRQARKVRNGEVEVLESARKAEADKQAGRSAAAKKAAQTRASKKAAKVNVPEGNGHRSAPEQVNIQS